MSQQTPEKMLDALMREIVDLPPRDRESAVDRFGVENPDLQKAASARLGRLQAIEDHLDPPNLTGELVSGRFRVLEQIGAGGMGVVYRAEDTRLHGRPVALKFLPSHTPTESQIRRFRERETLAAKIGSDRVARVYEADCHQGSWYIAMEYIEGETLDRLVSQEGPIPVARALRIAVGIAEALEAAHSEGFVHRDLKPSNVMLTTAGEVKLLDFGLAKALADESDEDTEGFALSAGAVGGTPGYMSPEQSDGRETGPSTDIWSLGKVLFDLLAGAQRSTAPSAQGARPLPDLGSLPRTLPRGVKAILRNCLQSDAGLRWSDASLVANALRHEIWWLPWRRGLMIVGPLALAVTVIAVGLSLREPELVRVELAPDGSLVGHGVEGPIWPGPPTEPVHGNLLKYLGTNRSFHRPFVILPDRRQTVVVSVTPERRNGDLLFLDGKSGDVLHRYTLNWTPPAGAGKSAYLASNWQVPVSRPDRPEPVLAIGMKLGASSARAVLLLTTDREPLGTYYHPGAVWFEREVDADGDGDTEYLISGANNAASAVRELVDFPAAGMACGFVALLDPGEVKGQAYPWSPESRGAGWLGMPHAREHAYVVFPLACPDRESIVLDVRSLRDDGFEVHLDDGRLFYLDRDLLPRSYWASVPLCGEESETGPVTVAYLRGGVLRYIEVPARPSENNVVSIAQERE